MNKVQLIGRLTKDVEVRYSQGDTQMAIARFTVAVDRRGKNNEADFISCVAFGKTGEFIEKYFAKGNRIGICGHIQTGSYTDKDGKKVYTTDVIADEAEFVESKGQGGAEQTAAKPATDDNGFMNIPDNIDEDLPFA